MIQLKNRPFAGKAPTTTQQAEFSIGWRFCPVCGNKLYQKIEGCSGILQVKCNRCKETLRLDLAFRWLKSQSTYQLQKSKKETHEEPPLKLQCPKNGKYYSFQEIQAFYGISRPTLDSWVLKEGIPTMKLGRVKRIQKDAFDEVLKSKRKVEEDV